MKIEFSFKHLEKGKAYRINQQNTQQSKLIKQRKKDLTPITFESNVYKRLVNSLNQGFIFSFRWK